MNVSSSFTSGIRPGVIVGSSRGGAVAMNLNNDAMPLVLLRPVWKRWKREHGQEGDDDP